MALNAVPAASLLAALAVTALTADRAGSVAAVTVILLSVCLARARHRAGPYLIGALFAALTVFIVTPLAASSGADVVWRGPIVPVIGELNLTREELVASGLGALRLAAVSLAFAAYALLLDHDRLVQAVGFARRSALAVALATRLVPTLERDAAGLVEALRGRGVEVRGSRGRARLLAPLLTGSLERGLNLAEAMEARGFGRAGRTRMAAPPASALDRAALALAGALVAAGALWL